MDLFVTVRSWKSTGTHNALEEEGNVRMHHRDELVGLLRVDEDVVTVQVDPACPGFVLLSILWFRGRRKTWGILRTQFRGFESK